MGVPKCRKCGNTVGFGVGSIDPPAKTAQGPVCGLWGEFDGNGDMVRVMSTRSDNEQRDELAANPDMVDTCMECGSRDIDR